MTQQIVGDYPPLYDDIAAAFGLKPKDTIIFSWGNQIYNPSRVDIPSALIAHEAVHGQRQGSGQQIVDWWKRYIEDGQFRLSEEIPAHRAECWHIQTHGNRYERRSALRITADRLAASLYGRLITPAQAFTVLKTGGGHGP